MNRKEYTENWRCNSCIACGNVTFIRNMVITGYGVQLICMWCVREGVFNKDDYYWGIEELIQKYENGTAEWLKELKKSRIEEENNG